MTGSELEHTELTDDLEMRRAIAEWQSREAAAIC